MASVSKAYGATGTSDLIHINVGQTYTYVITGSATATWVIEYTTDQTNWIEVATGTADQTSVTATNPTTQPKGAIWVRSRCSSYGSGTMTVVTADATDTVRGSEIIDGDGLSVFKAVDGGIQMGGTLAVTGASTLTGNVAAAGTLAVTGITTLTGKVNGSTLSMSGAATITGAVTHTSTTALNDDVTMADAKNIVINTSTGTKIGTASSQKIGLWGATPVVQASALTGATSAATFTTTTGSDSTFEAVTSGVNFGMATKAQQEALVALAVSSYTRIGEMSNILKNAGLSA